MTWAFKRQIVYLIILILFFSFLGFLIISPRLSKPPTCSDYRQNGDETGIDCGGSCPNACSSQVDEVSVLWARAFEVVPGRYNAVAYLINHNKNAAIEKISYRFRFADANNIYIGKREGTTFVPPGGAFAVFEPGIDIGNSIPVYTTFELTGVPIWRQISQELINQLKVSISDIQLTGETSSPQLSATVFNNSLFIIPDIKVIAVLYDADHNAVSVSSTYLSSLGREERRNIAFTWPEPLPGETVAKEIIPLYNIFSAKLK